MRMYHLDNDTLGPFLKREKDPWVTCRWINVNGLSWDVVRLLGNHKGLHRLSIEDLMHSINRTKADWFSDHTYIVLAMQKLIKLPSEDGCDDSDGGSDIVDAWLDETKAATASNTSKSKGRQRKKRKRRGVTMYALMDYLTP